MKPRGRFLGGVLVLGLLLAAIVGASFGIKWVVDRFSGLDPSLATVAAIAAITMLLSAQIIAGAIRKATRQNRPELSSGAKCEVYLQLVENWLSALNESKAGNGQDSRDRETDRSVIERKLVLLGTPEVIKHYQEFRSRTQAGDPHLAMYFEGLLLEMRKDLGQGNLGLRKNRVLLELVSFPRQSDPWLLPKS